MTELEKCPAITSEVKFLIPKSFPYISRVINLFCSDLVEFLGRDHAVVRKEKNIFEMGHLSWTLNGSLVKSEISEEVYYLTIFR